MGFGMVWDSLWIEYHMVGILFGLVWFGEWNRKVIEEVDTGFMGLSNRGQQSTRHSHNAGIELKKVQKDSGNVKHHLQNQRLF